MSNEPKITRRKISDYTPDPNNANEGTERGQYMVDKSIEQTGAARSIVSTADDTIPAGNKTLQAAADAGIEDVIEIETDGTQLVVVKRTDWQTVDDEQARKYAYFDNRASEVGLEWNPEQLLADLDAGVELGDLWYEGELEDLLAQVSTPGIDDLADKYGESRAEDFWPSIQIKVPPDIYDQFEALMLQAPGENEADRFASIVRVVDAALFGSEPS